MAGVKGIADINQVLRADPALQAAFGRTACAEQSTLQDTLGACTQETIAQMEAAWEELAHNVLVWAKEWLLPAVPRLQKYGVERLVREVLGILGRGEWEPQ
jgi:hypothetical protein